MISMMSSNIQNLLEKTKQEALKLKETSNTRSETSNASSRTSSPSSSTSLSPASTSSFSYFTKTNGAAAAATGIDYGGPPSAAKSTSSSSASKSASKQLNTSRDSNDDPRTMDAADTLVSLAHSAASTPTVESKPLLPVAKTGNFEICINASDLESSEPNKPASGGETSDGKEEGKDASQQAVESACKLILQQVLKSCPGANLSSITIKTTTQPLNTDAPTTTTTTHTLQIKTNGTSVSLEPEPSVAVAAEPVAAAAVVKKEPAKLPESARTPTNFKGLPMHLYSSNNNNNSKRNSSISSLNSLSSQSVVSALSTPSSEDIFTMRSLICMDEQDQEPLSGLARSFKRAGNEAGTPSESVNAAFDNIMNLINMSKSSAFAGQARSAAPESAEPAAKTPLKRPSTISAKQGALLNASSGPVPLKASSPIPATSPGFAPAKKIKKEEPEVKAAAEKASAKRSAAAAKEENEDTMDMSDSDYDYSDDSSDSINGEIYRKSSDASGRAVGDKKRRKHHAAADEANTSISSRSAPTLATGRRSKDSELPPDEAKKRQERRERNKEAAARCRRKREELTVSLSKKTELLCKERDSLRQLALELAKEKNRLESTFFAHERACHGGKPIARPVAITISPTTPTKQGLLRVKKEELNEIIKQSAERKRGAGGTGTGVAVPTTPQLINSLVSASAAFPSSLSGFNSLLTPVQSEHHHAFHHHSTFNANSFTNAVLEAAAAKKQQEQQQQQQQQQSNLLSPSKYGSSHSNATVAAINELLAAAVSHQAQQNYQASSQAAMESYFAAAAANNEAQQRATAAKSPSAQTPASSSLQRPNNLNLKSPSGGPKNGTGLSTSSAVSQSLVQELFASFNGSGVSSSQTPGGAALQLNTPIIFALTPLEATLNTLNAFANCTTPVLSQQASTFLTPNSASLASQHEQFSALNDAFLAGAASSMYSSAAAAAAASGNAANNYK